MQISCSQGLNRTAPDAIDVRRFDTGIPYSDRAGGVSALRLAGRRSPPIGA